MNRNLNIFLLNGIPVGSFMGILFGSLYGADAGLWSGLATGLVFGALMYLALGFLHSRAVGKIRGSSNADIFNVCHTRSLRLPMPYERVYKLCVEALRLMRGCTLEEENYRAGKISARTSINWKTWGDSISLEVERSDNDSSMVKIASRPSSWTTLVDYGKNLQNVNEIVAFLEKSLGRISPGSPEGTPRVRGERINSLADHVT